jgi:hypothetical protein
MNDTNPEIEKIFREMIMKKSGEERMMMGFSMFDSAREIVIASIKNENPDISEIELKKKLFLRFYGTDFTEEQKQKILECINNL